MIFLQFLSFYFSKFRFADNQFHPDGSGTGGQNPGNRTGSTPIKI
jgi:hypothetical protein